MRPFQPSDVPWATALWNRLAPERYALCEDDVAWRTVDHPTFRGEASFAIPEQGFIVAKSSGTPHLFSGQDAARWHIGWAAFLSVETVQQLVPGAAAAAVAAGAERLVLGMDADHFLPGAPDDWPGYAGALVDTGFEPGGTCFDLERDLGGYRLPPRCREALDRAGARVQPCEPGNTEPLLAFFDREFPGRWKHDVVRKVVQDGEPEAVHVLVVRGRIEGFAMTQREGCKRPVAGAVWRRDLGASWGALGPIGVSAAVRGQGLGDALLGSALQALADQGARRTIIDWTTLDDFYGPHGFEVSRRYLSLGCRLV